MGKFYCWAEPSNRSFALFCSPLGFHFHSPCATCCVLAKTTPLPVFRALAQPALHRIPVNIAKLFDELAIIPKVEIVISLFPEVLGIADQSPPPALFQRLECFRECRA